MQRCVSVGEVETRCFADRLGEIFKIRIHDTHIVRPKRGEMGVIGINGIKIFLPHFQECRLDRYQGGAKPNLAGEASSRTRQHRLTGLVEGPEAKLARHVHKPVMEVD